MAFEEVTCKLGFGLMRLPRQGEEINIKETSEMVDLFLEAGCNYFDTAWLYTGSEEAAREALVKRYPRERFLLATKLSAWAKCRTREDAVAQFQTSLDRSGAGYFDYYLLHNLGGNRTRFYDDFGLWDFAQEKKEQGLIRHVGLSCHCTAEELDEILTRHPEMEFVQLQINYADWEDPVIQSRKCYEVARKHGKRVIVMEPVKGGMLANPPGAVREIMEQADAQASFASWAIRFAASLDGVDVVLSGMSNIAQMRDNLSFMSRFRELSRQEAETICQAQKALAEIPVVPCTSCNYCVKVCPQNIGIPETFSALNLVKLFGDRETAVLHERWNVEGQGKKTAGSCIGCGKCESACPQRIDIRKFLQEAEKTFRP